MAERTGIQWTQATWNPWHGCLKVSAGCSRCYMYTEKKAYGQNPAVVVRSKTKFRDPLKWRQPLFVFTCSWSDFFIAEADAWRAEAWDIIRQTPHHTYQILTKRPERIAPCLPPDWGEGWSHVWLGVSAESRRWWVERVGQLRQVSARVRWVSAEPLLEELCLAPSDLRDMDWVVFGGESGPRARACALEWLRSGVLDCRRSGVPVFVKQLGARPTLKGEPAVLRDKKGGELEEWPDDLQVREFPRGWAA